MSVWRSETVFTGVQHLRSCKYSQRVLLYICTHVYVYAGLKRAIMEMYLVNEGYGYGLR